MKIAIGADHHGFKAKEYIQHQITDLDWLDVGTFDEKRTDYPLFAQNVCKALLAGQVEQGILLCGTGIGMAIAANRFKGIYAGLAWNKQVAQRAKEDDNVNVLVIPSDFVSPEQMVAMINVWRSALFNKGRYAKRIAMIDDSPNRSP